MKVGLVWCREEPPKFLQGNRFQERTFQIKKQKLLLLKDKKVRGALIPTSESQSRTFIYVPRCVSQTVGGVDVPVLLIVL